MPSSPQPETVAPRNKGQRNEKQTSRLEAFSDGVFAIAITLLVLDLKVPHASDLNGRSLPQALLQQWPTELAFLISFVTILIMWMNHHRLFTHIRYSDHTLLLLNGVLLLGVTFIPFPTALLAEYIRTPEARFATAFYSASFIFISLCFQALWNYASGHLRLLDEEHEPELAAAISRQYRFGPLYYVVAVALSYFSAAAGVGLCMALAVFFALPHRRQGT